MRATLASQGRALLLLSFLMTAAGAQDATDASARAAAIRDATGVRGGLVVHIGCGDGRLTAALGADAGFLVQGLDPDPVAVAGAREHVRSLGLYGRVSVDRLRGARLPYVDHLVNLVIAESVHGVTQDELLRVLAPGGVAYVKREGEWHVTRKPRPEEIDDWTHFLHDATGNAVARDTVVGPPRHLQWLGSPRWSRHHDRMASMSALVSEGGRIFYIMDEGSRVSIQLPPRWKLIARDAFNGTILWKRDIERWHSHLWPLKSGPTQLARRLVATEGVVYVTLGLTAPLTAVDAVTGATLRTYEDSASTEEVIVADGVVLLLVNKGLSELTAYSPKLNVGDQQRVANEVVWNAQERVIMAFEADSGRALWKRTSRVSPFSLTSDGRRVCYHDGERVVAVAHDTGDELWTTGPAARRRTITMNFGPRVVMYEDLVLYAGGDRTMRAYAAETGKELWTAPHARSAYQSPEDLLIAGGLVWSAPTTSTNDSGVFTGRDPRTGEVKVEFPPDVDTYWFHHRCYMAKATERFLLPSRTGIEFVDFRAKHWEIHHWVRGGCLYGIMPCNGLVYAPPHDCACYPEAKLFGLNALAPASPGRDVLAEVSEDDRLERGPAFDALLDVPSSIEDVAADWPVFRYDNLRSGATRTELPAELAPEWTARLGGRLSSPVVAGGRVVVASIDEHTVHALNAANGARVWSHTAGGRVDSPPTLWRGRAIFGSADGSVTCLNAVDGTLCWRFRAAPADLRLTAFEQIESVWPVHGSVLVEDGVAHVVAGRSNFLDGGLRLLGLDAATGRKLSEQIIGERDPETGENVQARLQVLNMTVGLPDVLSSDGRWVYMRSQRFDMEGKRQGVGPFSGVPAEQGADQHGEGAHVFAPMGFLDDTWFHRAYWVYGRSFAGGHAGYYQAGKYAPSGRILVFDDERVYGFGRKPEYYRWTTTLEHQLFAASKSPPAAAAAVRRGGSMVRFEKRPSIDPTEKAIAVEAWIKPERPNGVVVARGGPTHGYALYVSKWMPHFAVRADGVLHDVEAKVGVQGDWAHLVGMVTPEKELRIFVNGELAGSAPAASLIPKDPAQSLEIGADDGSSVGEYRSPFGFTGAIDEVRVYHGVLHADEIRERCEELGRKPARDAALVLSCSFDAANANDDSGNDNHGRISGASTTKGKLGNGLHFTGAGARSGGSFVEPFWTESVPLLVYAMVLAGETLFVAGPPDVLDEEESFKSIVAGDDAIAARIREQDEALDGRRGGVLLAVSARDGAVRGRMRLGALPVWDGMAAARGKLYVSSADGTVVCLTGDSD